MESFFEVNGQELRLTNLDKVLWPREGFTKSQLIKYYLEAAPYLLKYLRNRPVVFQRFPGGIQEKGFYQKNFPLEGPSWVKTFSINSRSSSKVTRYILVEDVQTLAWLGNQACIEIHPWFSSLQSLENPDFAVFDLDPMEESTFEQVCSVSLTIRDLLVKVGLKCYPKTSGSTGLQVYVPLKPRYSYEEVRKFVSYFCSLVHDIHPQITTMERKVDKRQGKIYLDYLQNAWGKTINAPYSIRPHPGAPVSTPLLWEEIQQGNITSSSAFHLLNIKERLEAKGDLFEGVLTGKQSIDGILENLMVSK
ncbi:non-homologous end-joining DNA ligase [Candidatus Contubernalis alkaliaceticus]|uniref:non-homologous end-joining DNA ligase n=1 Tax=Candidatus Contubernalis alkaliaceticus TaxID=338645 RepID=UPI001F4C08B6|nr:non-homologous end-joining DNA ligase [Candidatus Contubernalis alkalaceticus]UNC93959.1 DNA polymerase domain-containing protein [Candidatus Contubernalis alkalaceticus]